MRFSTTAKLAVMAVPIFFHSVSSWSFTMYDVEDCGNSTASGTVADKVEQPGDVVCDPIPNADQHKSVLGAIPSGSDCRISFYPVENCGGRVAFGLTQYTNTCLSVADFVSPLTYYKATGCS